MPLPKSNSANWLAKLRSAARLETMATSTTTKPVAKPAAPQTLTDELAAAGRTVKALPEGTIITPDDLPDGDTQWPRNKKLLDQLVKDRELMRVERATYITPVLTGTGTQDIEPTFEAYVAQADETITWATVTAAYALRLSKHYPMREIRHTSGRSREVIMGNYVFELRHVPDWQLLLGNTKPGLAIRYFSWGGESWAHHFAWRLTRVLDEADWEAIEQVADKLPDWVRDAVQERHTAQPRYSARELRHA